MRSWDLQESGRLESLFALLVCLGLGSKAKIRNAKPNSMFSLWSLQCNQRLLAVERFLFSSRGGIGEKVSFGKGGFFSKGSLLRDLGDLQDCQNSSGTNRVLQHKQEHLRIGLGFQRALYNIGKENTRIGPWFHISTGCFLGSGTKQLNSNVGVFLKRNRVLK